MGGRARPALSSSSQLYAASTALPTSASITTPRNGTTKHVSRSDSWRLPSAANVPSHQLRTSRLLLSSTTAKSRYDGHEPVLLSLGHDDAAATCASCFTSSCPVRGRECCSARITGDQRQRASCIRGARAEETRAGDAGAPCKD